MMSQLHSAPLDLDPALAVEAWASAPGCLLLEGGREWRGRACSALLTSPRWILRQDRDGRRQPTGKVPPLFLDPDRDLIETIFAAQPRRDHPTTTPAFCGLAGYFGYEATHLRRGLRRSGHSRFDLEDIWLGAYDRALVFGPHLDLPLLVVAESPLFDSDPVDLPQRWEEAAEELKARRKCESGVSVRTGAVEGIDADWHRAAVETIQSHLRSGESYQVNLTGFASARSDLDPFLAYRHESRNNPVCFSAFLRHERAAISCHSPELLLRMRGERAETAPIKGTWPAGAGAESHLLASQKDRAEHVMIVDLCRNDLGRSARYGSVEVADFAKPIHLRGLVHLISSIRARVDDASRGRVLADLFPAGSITGAPKRRTMEIIAEVEAEERGPYTGSIGYVDILGNADWNIAIRTAIWQDHRVHFGCGGGIVLDSDPAREYEEMQWKSASFFESLQEATRASSSGDALHSKESVS